MIPKPAVLFARSDSIYKTMDCDVWDKERNALNWTGGAPIVAHPPCRLWGCLAARSGAALLENFPMKKIICENWDRKLWGITFTSSKEPRFLIGRQWHIVKEPDYPGDPSGVLLFRTRKQARAWVQGLRDRKVWFAGRVRVVRVRELVEAI